jgi:chitosanase
MTDRRPALPAFPLAVLFALAAACSGSDPTQSRSPASTNGGPSQAQGPASGPSGAPGGFSDAGGATPPGSADSGATGTTDGGSLGASDGGGSDGSAPPAGDMTSLQKHKAEMLTSIWENSTTVLQYPYCQNIGDGRGYTSGRAGFCSGTGDAIQVVDCFDKAFGTGASNPMAKYMPALTTINDKFNSTGQDQGDTSALDAVGNYCGDWASAANGSATTAGFKACQDQIVDLLYYKPALDQAKKWGVTTALAKAELYDAEINHGDDGVTSLVKQANIAVGNTAQTPPAAPRSQADESAWLHAFLMARLAVLKADKTWADSVDRVTTYEQARLDGNFDLSAKIETNAKAVTMYPGQGYKDSGYPDCVLDAAGAVSGDASCTSPTGQ